MSALTLTVAVITIGIIIVIILAVHGRERVLERRRIIAQLQQDLTSKYQLDEIYISEKDMNLIGICWDASLFYIGSAQNDVVEYAFNRLRAVELCLDQVTVTQSHSTTTSKGLGSAAVGGLMFGATGAVIGGLGAGSETRSAAQSSENLCSIDIVIRTDDPQTPLHHVNFWDLPEPGISRHAPYVKELLDTAYRFQALLKKIIEDTDASASQMGQDSSVKLDRLWQLHQQGALTKSEFETQKRAILGG